MVRRGGSSNNDGPSSWLRKGAREGPDQAQRFAGPGQRFAGARSEVRGPRSEVRGGQVRGSRGPGSGSPRAVWGGRVPEHQPGGELEAERLQAPVLDLAQQQADGGTAQLGQRLADGGQGRDGDGGLDGVVE